MTMYTLNIGLEGTTDVEALKTLHANDITPHAWRIDHSNTEPTLILKAQHAKDAQLHAVSVALNQDCIAVQHHTGRGALVGPNKAAWEPFEPAYFLEF